MSGKKTLVIRNGNLIDGSGNPTARNDAVVVEGNRIKSVGALPGDLQLADRANVEVLDAAGQWIMPGLIDAHCHVSYGYPMIKGEGKGKGTTRPEFSTLKSARSVQKVLRSGVTSISVPGGTWFTDVGIRDAIRLGLMEGPRMYVAGRMIVTYGCIEDDEPSWEGTPDHSIGKLCNTTDEMVTEVRRQGKHGVNFIKMADSRSGESQMLAREEIAAVVGEAHRRNLRVGIHSRGAGSTRAAAEAGVDWIIHADLATEADLEAVAKAGMPIIPTATFLAIVIELGNKVGQEQIQIDTNRMKRHYDALGALMHKAREMGIKLLVGTDTGNNSFTPMAKTTPRSSKSSSSTAASARCRPSWRPPGTTPMRSALKVRSAKSPPGGLPTSSSSTRIRSPTSPCCRAAVTSPGSSRMARSSIAAPSATPC
jgi:imidazolonepropionase-like amidohydrolase